MSRQDRVRPQISRTQLASTAARLMAQDGIIDYVQARQRAARQLGLPENHFEQPSDREIEEELRLYHALYQGDEHIRQLRELRLTALAVMRQLERFNPYLTGSVLDGTAGPQARIDILLFADSAKEVEIFLLDHAIDFDHAEPRNERAEAVLVLNTDVAEVNLIIFPPQAERIHFKGRDGRPRERVRSSALTELINTQEAA
jgi:hypothetical protein